MGKYKGKWCVLTGFKAEHLAEIAPIVERLKAKFPEQSYNIMNSRFPIYDFILVCFADDRNSAHKIGMALVKKELPAHLNMLYWVKEVNLLKYNVEEDPSVSTAKNHKT